MDPRAINNNIGVPQSFPRTAPAGSTGPVDTQAFEAALGGSATPASRAAAAPSAQSLFQSMAPGLMFNPVANAAPATANPVSSARDSLYSRLGVETPAGLQGTARFLSQRGLESEGPVMSFGHAAELVLAS